MDNKKINGIFEGGGVKGTALIGAAVATAELGYTYEYLAGTSAGAITAALLSAYAPHEVKEIMASLDFRQFADHEAIERIPFIGSLIAEEVTHGVLWGRHLESWLGDLLAKRGIYTFHDLVVDETEINPRKRYKLHVIASDITKGKMIVLPDDLPDYGIDINSFPVAKAVRCSMAIPFVFTPVMLKDCMIVDGALYSNCPIWLFDEDASLPCPTVGYRLVDPADGKSNHIGEFVGEAKAVFLSLLDSVDKFHINSKEFARCVPIPTLGVGTIEFGLSDARKEDLYVSGHLAATNFFQKWDYEAFKQGYTAR